MSNEAIESLKQFAMSHNEIEFARLCDAALDGDELAVKLLQPVMQVGFPAWKHPRTGLIEDPPYRPFMPDLDTLDAIRSTDCTLPDGAIARGLVTP